MNPKEDTFVTYRRRKSRYMEDLEFEDIQLEDTNSDMDPTGYTLTKENEHGKRKTGWHFIV